MIEKGNRVVVTNPDSCFVGKKGRVINVKHLKEVTLMDVWIEKEMVVFTKYDLKRED